MRLGDEWGELMRAVLPATYEQPPAAPGMDAWARIEANRAAESLARMEAAANRRSVQSTAPSSPASRLYNTNTAQQAFRAAEIAAQNAAARSGATFSHAKPVAARGGMKWPAALMLALGGVFLIKFVGGRR